jgi:hypothetical protein
MPDTATFIQLRSTPIRLRREFFPPGVTVGTMRDDPTAQLKGLSWRRKSKAIRSGCVP